ncbi:MAG: Eco29kI family restriction endonuclease, partial [Chlorobium sp.]
KGGDLEASPGKVLFNRLMQHKRSIEEASNLDIADFLCRYLIVDDIWIPLGETLLITKFDPLWNKLIDGFGNHDPGKGRHDGLRPRWDVLHPGRSWADRCQLREETAEQIIGEARDYLRNNPPPDDSTMITT